MFENIISLFKKINKKDEEKTNKETAKERLHLVLMQDRANVSADFLDMMKQEIIDVIKKYIDVDEDQIDVKLTNKQNSDGTTGAPALYANIPIKSIKNEVRIVSKNTVKLENNKTDNAEVNKVKGNKGAEKKVTKNEQTNNIKDTKKKEIKSEKNEKVENSNKEVIKEKNTDGATKKTEKKKE